MELLSKPFVVLATRWKRDAFLRARVGLLALYSGVTIVLVGLFSYLLYGSLYSELGNSIEEQVADPLLGQLVLDKANDVLQNQIIFADSIVLFFILLIGFALTTKTLQPLKRALSRERRFVADASHELRTPLAVMKTTVEVALRHEKLPDVEVKQVLTSVLEEINGLTKLANNLLDLSKQKEAIPTFSKVSLGTVLATTEKRLEPLAREKHLKITSVFPPTALFVLGDPIALGQMFYNILHNAIMYTPPSGEIAVVIVPEAPKVIVRVQDSGIGIPPEKIALLMQPFFRTANAREMSPGAGLGLAIAETIAGSHGGDIAIISELGVGTTMSISLPLSSS